MSFILLLIFFFFPRKGVNTHSPWASSDYDEGIWRNWEGALLHSL